jgi:hypothetical protein
LAPGLLSFFFVMNKNSQILRRPQKLSLGDLILAVSSCTKSSRETVATVADLLGSGRVRVEDHGRFLPERFLFVLRSRGSAAHEAHGTTRKKEKDGGRRAAYANPAWIAQTFGTRPRMSPQI